MPEKRHASFLLTSHRPILQNVDMDHTVRRRQWDTFGPATLGTEEAMFSEGRSHEGSKPTHQLPRGLSSFGWYQRGEPQLRDGMRVRGRRQGPELSMTLRLAW